MTAPDTHLASALMLILEARLDPPAEIDREILALARDEVQAHLETGAEVNGVYSDGYSVPESLLARAIGWRRRDIAELLLAHGARPTDPLTGHTGAYDAACGQPEMIRLLMAHGADPVRFDREDMPAALGTDQIPARPLPEGFAAQDFTVQRGRQNPQLCSNPFYLDQIRSFASAYAGAKAHMPDVRAAYDLAPVFSFDRFGRTITRLPDGRIVLIAGEHEDSYDSNFCIYNDVCVLDGKGGMAHYAYPVDTFPPTDFHSATLMGDHILLIGCLGYKDQRNGGRAQVLRLDLDSWRIRPLETGGDDPGWIHRHRAELHGDEVIVTSGRVEPGFRPMDSAYALNCTTLRWRKISGQPQP